MQALSRSFFCPIGFNNQVFIIVTSPEVNEGDGCLEWGIFFYKVARILKYYELILSLHLANDEFTVKIVITGQNQELTGGQSHKLMRQPSEPRIPKRLKR